MNTNNKVMLVNETDNNLHLMEKNLAHQQGLLHRAFSVFIFNDKGEMLIQQRAACKYHSAGLWANSCCGHPLHPSDFKENAEVRLNQELGIDVSLTWQDSFQYIENVSNNMVENEYVHLYMGVFNGELHINRNEVQAIKWIQWSDLLKQVTHQPTSFSSWFVHYMTKHNSIIHKMKNLTLQN
jgi:isopentenyl-diphosphate delta-isomerase